MTTREHWGSKIGFILAAVGSAVGLGVLWKFPYTVGQNGGGIFMLTYIICLLVIGLPVLVAELMIGRKTQRASVGAFSLLCQGKTGWKIGGWLGLIAAFLIMSFYSIIAGWGMSYVLMSLTGFYQDMTQGQIAEAFTLLSTSGQITLFWHFLFTLTTVMIVLSGVRKGIEFWSKIMTRGLFILLLILFFYALRLDGFGQAFHFVFYPDWNAFNFSSALEAIGLAFFTLSLGHGVMISYGSYMKDDVNIPKMTLIIVGSVVIVATLAALVVFPVVFTFDLSPASGTGIIFQTLPYLFAQLPGSLILSTLFFTLFVFTALTSAIPFVEVVATNLMELLSWDRRKAVLFAGSMTFLFGIPCALSGGSDMFPEWAKIYGQSFIETIQALVFIWIVPVTGLITAIFAGWVLDQRVAKESISPKIYPVWLFFMRFIIPIVILVVILEKSGIIG